MVLSVVTESLYFIRSSDMCMGGLHVCTCLPSQSSSTLGGSWKFAQLRKIVLFLSLLYLFFCDGGAGGGIGAGGSFCLVFM